MNKNTVIFKSLDETHAQFNDENTLVITQYCSGCEDPSMIYIPRQYLVDFIGHLIELDESSSDDSASRILQ